MPLGRCSPNGVSGSSILSRSSKCSHHFSLKMDVKDYVNGNIRIWLKQCDYHTSLSTVVETEQGHVPLKKVSMMNPLSLSQPQESGKLWLKMSRGVLP